MELYGRHSYDEALAEFRQAFALYPSPNIRLFVARCLRELGRSDDAAREYEITARDAADRGSERYLPTRDAALDEVRALYPRIGRVRLAVAGAPTWAWATVNQRAVPYDLMGSTVAVAPGPVHIRIEAHGYRTVERTVTVTAGEVSDVALDLARDPGWDGRPPGDGAAPPMGPAREAWIRPTAMGALGVGAVGLLGSGVLALIASTTYGNALAPCLGVPCTGVSPVDAATAGTLQTVATVALVVGVAAVGTGVGLWSWSGRTGAAGAGRVAVSVTGLSIQGRF